MPTTAGVQVETWPTELPTMPIPPDDIIAGNPSAHGLVLSQSEDRLVSSGCWTCEPGEFSWEFAWDEFAQVLEGEATITEEDGSSHTLKAGQAVSFPRGLKTRWQVTKTIKKFFVVRTREPLVLS